MDDTRPRFLTAIAARLGEDRIVELHLFSPIRQGVLETGVAVVAVLRAPEAEPAVLEAAPIDEVVAEVVAETEDSADDVVVVEAAVEADADAGVVADADEVAETDADVVAEAEVVDDAVEDAVEDAATAAIIPGLPDDRLVVYTARYRLTRKGPDRGKWLFEVAATADAPLATVDVVARGVTLRAKDVTETERLSGDQLRALLKEPAWRMAK